MKTQTINLNRTFALCTLLFALSIGVANAAVVSRNQRPSNAARMPTITTKIQNTNSTASTTETEPESVSVEPAIIETVEEEIIIEDKSSQFNEFMAGTTATTNDKSNSALAEQIRAQRAALDAADAATAASNQMAAARASGQNACDANLRACMREKCGNDYSKCAGDTDTLWGTKMDACRRDLPCTGAEYAMFATEIKADRDMNARVASYNAIVDCGNQYNNCIVTECGQKFTKCLGKKAGDAAISKCAKIANNCKSQDSGLASRAMSVFGDLRVNAEKQVARDEKRLYELRDLMRDTCGRLGAMFDERTLDCVYTVNFYAGEDNTLYASKKAYAGSSFNCDQNWFGVDITTFKENAMRLTRAQTSATSALMGSGIGIGVGAITSGAIDRAIDRHKAEKELKKAEKEHDELYGPVSSNDVSDNDDTDDTKPGAAERRCKNAGGTWANNTCTGANCGDKKTWDSTKNKCVKSKDSGEGTDEDKSERPDDETAKKNCRKAKGKWQDGICKNPNCGDNARWDDWTQTCKEYADGEKPLSIEMQQQLCKSQGVWGTATCICKNGGKWDTKTGMCGASPFGNGDKPATSTMDDQETACKIFGTWTGTTCICKNMGKWNPTKKMCECDPATQELKEGKCTFKTLGTRNLGTR